MDDRVEARQRFSRLAVVGEIGEQAQAVRGAVVAGVDVEDVVSLLAQVPARPIDPPCRCRP